MSSTPTMSPETIFYQQYAMVRRDEVIGVLLAVFLGCFGAHHFYVRRTGLGVLYCCLFWTGIPSLLGLIECFFMPARVRELNAVQAAGIAAMLGISVPLWQQPTPAPFTAAQPSAPAPTPTPNTLVACSQCGQTNPLGSRFCSGCGGAL